MEKERMNFQSSHSSLFQVLNDSPWVKKVFPSASNFFLVQVQGSFRGVTRVYDFFFQHQILIQRTDKMIADSIRISVPISDANSLEKLLGVIDKLNQQW